MALTSYTSMAKGLKQKVRKFWGLIRTFVEVTVEKLVMMGEEGWLPLSWIGLKKRDKLGWGVGLKRGGGAGNPLWTMYKCISRHIYTSTHIHTYSIVCRGFLTPLLYEDPSRLLTSLFFNFFRPSFPSSVFVVLILWVNVRSYPI